MAALQKRVSAVEVAAEPNKLCHKNCTSFNSQSVKRSQGDGDNSTSDPPASQALIQAPAAFAVRDIRAPTGLQSSHVPASVPMKPFMHKHVTDTMISDARQMVREDREKVAHLKGPNHGREKNNISCILAP